jgi:DNA-binding transcriptional ArsR family regulator
MASSAVSASPRPSLAEVQAHAGSAAQLLKALANEQRLLVLCSLIDGERSVGEINARVSLSQSALSQHLALLREAGIVTTRREAQTVWYGLAAGPAQLVMSALYEAFCAPDRSPSSRKSKELRS